MYFFGHAVSDIFPMFPSAARSSVHPAHRGSVMAVHPEGACPDVDEWREEGLDGSI